MSTIVLRVYHAQYTATTIVTPAYTVVKKPVLISAMLIFGYTYIYTLWIMF